MFLHHLNSLGCVNRATAAELEETRRRLNNIREESCLYDPERYRNISMRLCRVNLHDLSVAEGEARAIYRETSPGCHWITKIFKWFCFDSASRYDAAREHYLNLKNDIDALACKNRQALENRFERLITCHDEIDDPVELAVLFVHGCQKNCRRLKYKNCLRQVYGKIAAFSGRGSYGLGLLREVARGSRRLFYQSDVDVRVNFGGANFTFHGLLLENQCGVLRGEAATRGCLHLHGPDLEIFEMVHRFIEYGEEPDFDSIGEEGVYRFLFLCRTLELSKDLAGKAVRWLMVRSMLFSFKAKPEGLAVSCLVKPNLKVLRKLAYIEPFSSITALDISCSSESVNEMLHLAVKLCPNIRKLSCRPSGKVAAGSWKALFDLPSFKILQLDVVGINQDLIALKKAVSEHDRPLKIRLINHHLLPTDNLLAIALAIPNLSLLELDMRNDVTLGEMQKLFGRHPKLKVRYNNQSFKDYHSFYICYRSY